MSICNELGLELNFFKCEIFACGTAEETAKSLDSFCRLTFSIKTLPISKLSLLGASIHEFLFPDAILKKLCNFNLMREPLSSLSAHHSLFLLKNSIYIPRLIYLLRCTPCWKHLVSLQLLDDRLNSSLEDLFN